MATSPSFHHETLYQLPTYDHGKAREVLRLTWVFLFVDATVSLLLSSSWVAWRWYGLPVLGRPWLRFTAYPEISLLVAAGAVTAGSVLLLWFRRVRGATILALPLVLPLYVAALMPVYSPTSLLLWSARYQHVGPLARDLGRGSSLFLLAFAGTLATTVSFTLAGLRALRESGDTHGSSHWASPREVRKTGLLQSDGGVVVGAWRDTQGSLQRLADLRDRHVLAFAPSGSGKSTCLVIPTLFSWKGSALVLDVKGELWHLTAGFRQQRFGQRCIRFDPSCADGTTGGYNPLASIPRGPEDVKYAQSVADVLVDPEGRDKPRSFWDQSAHSLLVATILHVLYFEREKSLAGCAYFLADPQRPILATIAAMRTAGHDPSLLLGWRDPQTNSQTPTHPAVAAAAQAILDMDPRTSSGVIATAQSFLSLFRDPILARNTAESDFRASDLIRGDKPVSLYLTISPAEIDRLRPLLRIVLNQLCRQLTQQMAFDAAPEAAPSRHPLLLLLDEFTILGKLDFFGRAMAYLRGYGIRVFLSIQSLAQLYEIYGQHQSITANCPVQVAFAPADVETAELLSRMTGPTTVSLTKRSLSGSIAFTPRRTSISHHEVARPLLTSEEVRRLPDDEALVFTAGHAPVRGVRFPYYCDPALAAFAAIPGPPTSDRIAQTSDWSQPLAEPFALEERPLDEEMSSSTLFGEKEK